MSNFLLSKKNGSCHLSNVAWFQILNLAEQYGWEPSGTVDPYPWWEEEIDKSDWDGGYTHHEGQTVKSEDAKNMADALRPHPRL